MAPWGTILSGEENVDQYFTGGEEVADEKIKKRLKRYGIQKAETERKWERFDDRFNLRKEPNEPNRFNYVIEVNPWDASSTPVKHTTLGRFKHEGSNIHVTSDGTGKWIKLVTVNKDGSAESHVEGMSGEEVLVYTREAADHVGATKMDRPENVEPHPTTGKVYAALTNNKYRGAVEGNQNYEAAREYSPVKENKNGYILEIDDDHAGEELKWNLLLVCGDPTSAETYFGGFDKSKVSPISCPDNVTFDSFGNLWISTDGNTLKK